MRTLITPIRLESKILDSALRVSTCGLEGRSGRRTTGVCAQTLHLNTSTQAVSSLETQLA